jgi:hypothetical protein
MNAMLHYKTVLPHDNIFCPKISFEFDFSYFMTIDPRFPTLQFRDFIFRKILIFLQIWNLLRCNNWVPAGRN